MVLEIHLCPIASFIDIIQMEAKGMTERVERIIRGRDTESSQLLFENIINRHRTDGVSCFLPREQPVVLSCLWIASKDVSTKYLVSSIRKDSITVRTVLAFGNIDTFL